MTLPDDFVRSFESIHPKALFEQLATRSWPARSAAFELHNEIRPVDLYCYFGGRFGAPNGIQNFTRADDSDNLIHWEWTLRCGTAMVTFQGMNFRTEVHIFGKPNVGAEDRELLVEQIRRDFAPNASGMSEVRKALEHWTEFVNPYQRIRRSVDKLMKEIDELHLDPEANRIDDLLALATDMELRERWKDTSARFSRGFGLCFGVRSMLPVLAEAFVNFVLYVLMRPELKNDQRLRENAFRQPIDVRIKSLSINCRGFKCQPDYSQPACKRYHSMVNERNDLLHGNVVIDKLKFNEVHFHGRVPVFREYRSMWERALGVEMNAVGLAAVREEISVVDGLRAYVLSCLDDNSRRDIELLLEKYELGICSKDGHLGVLFPPWLVDMHVELPTVSTIPDELTR